MRSWRTVLCSLIVAISMQAHSEPLFRVTYLSPEELDTPFWDQIAHFIQAVAEDLNIALDIVVESSDNRFQLKNEGLKIIKKPDRPDFLITSYYPNVTTTLIEAGKEHNVGVFVFNAGLSEEDSQKVGRPRERFPNWIGHMQPDGTQAGFMLANVLLQKAREQHDTAGPINIIALRGRELSDIYSKDWREYGLKRRVSSSNDANIAGSMACDWEAPIAKQNAEKMLTEIPNIRIIWAASDEMALAGAEAVEVVGKTPGKDVLIGGFDWTAQALQAIGKGRMTASMGGHFMEAGWALLLLHDYHQGIDFADELGTQIQTSMQPITADNVQRYLQKFGDQNWSKIDFKQYSKAHNPALEKYDFSLDALLK